MAKILSIFLAFQVLLSSMSFSIGTHFCGGELKSFALFGEATLCEHARPHEHSAQPSCHSAKPVDGEGDEKGCCEVEQIEIEGEEYDFLISSLVLDFDSSWELSPLSFSEAPVLFNRDISFSYYFPRYKPPPLQRNALVLFQSFLI